uniref:Uncharacterized protein n=1 Tax=Lepeophtheirus salmonis TaxID=72036 RepID=A0A0K2SZU2_LEPSM
MSASKKIIGRDIVEYLRNEALVGRMNKKKLQTLASSMGVLNRVKEEFDKTLSEPESRSK